MHRLRLMLAAMVLATAGLLPGIVPAQAHVPGPPPGHPPVEPPGRGPGFAPFAVPLGPAPPNQEGAGLAVMGIHPPHGRLCYAITVSGIGMPVEPAEGVGDVHIHDKLTGGIFVPLETHWFATGVDQFTTVHCAAADRERLNAVVIEPEAYYLNIHTAAYPAGAIAGPLE